MKILYFSSKSAAPLQQLLLATNKMRLDLQQLTALPPALDEQHCLIFDFPQLASHRPDLLCRKVRALPGGQRIHLLGLISSAQQEELLPKLLDAGLNDFLVLPAPLLVIESKLRLAIAATASSRELPDPDYKTMVEASNDGICVLRLGKTVYRNPHWQELLGFTTEETKERSYFDFIAPEDLERLRQYYAKRVKEYSEPSQQERQVPETFETTVITRDGRRINVEVMSHNIRYDNEPATLIMLRDITERLRTLAALHRSEERYRIISELTNDITFASELTAAGSLAPIWITDAFARITGYDLSQEQATPWDKITHPEDQSLIKQLLDEVVQGGRQATTEFRILTKQGGVRWIKGTIRPELDPQTGQITTIIGAGQDITERKQVEEAIDRRNQDLFELNKKLEQLHRAKDEFTSLVTTELRGPLVTSLGYIELLLSGGFGPISEKLAARMKIAVKNLRRMTRLIEDMLKYNNLIDDTFVDTPELQVCDLVDVAKEVRQQFLAQSGVTPSRITFSTPKRPLQVLIDRAMIKTVLENLLDNAQKHAGPDAEIRLQLEHTGDKEIQVTVEDTGRGIPSGIRERAFLPFIKGEESSEGYGLGLAVVAAVLRAHKAKHFLRSEQNKGTSFLFWLPVAAGEVQHP